VGKLGMPEYGGELAIRANNKIVNFDPYDAPSGNIHSAWMERLVSGDWTLDPSVFDFLPHWHPSQSLKDIWRKLGIYRPRHLCRAFA